jgi:cob(I)alamin adenosyltransferase
MSTKIYTKTGDKGSTSLLGGTRVSKNDARLEAAGNIDELSSAIGFIRYQTEQDDQLKQIQINLFHIGALLGTDPDQFDISKLKQITEEDVKVLESWIDEMEEDLNPLKNFILPTGIIHLPRAICRRAERRLVSLKLPEIIVKYINRLSDYLFTLARYQDKMENIEEEIISQDIK